MLSRSKNFTTAREEMSQWKGGVIRAHLDHIAIRVFSADVTIVPPLALGRRLCEQIPWRHKMTKVVHEAVFVVSQVLIQSELDSIFGVESVGQVLTPFMLCIRSSNYHVDL